MINWHPGPKQTRHSMQSKQKKAIKFTVKPGYSLCYTENVRELMSKEYFKIVLVSKSYYLKQQGCH